MKKISSALAALSAASRTRMVEDAEIEACIAGWSTDTNDDHVIRHAHIQQEALSGPIPRLTAIVIGGDHIATGIHADPRHVSSHPLESYFPQHRKVVLEPQHYPEFLKVPADFVQLPMCGATVSEVRRAMTMPPQ